MPVQPRGERTVAAALRGERAAAAVLLGSGPVAALATVGMCLLAAVLVPFGGWRPIVVAPLTLVVAAAVVRCARRVPVRHGPPVPVWSAVLCVLLAVAFAIWAGSTHGEHVVLRRDSGSYALYAHWLATHHGLPVSAGLSAFGGPAAFAVPGFTLDSPAFYQVITAHGAEILPQFLLGAPAMYSMGWWLDGWTGLFVAPAIFGGLSVLAAGSLTARLVGPRWAPLAAAGFGLTLPLLHTARSNLSEPVATLLVLGAAALAADAVVLHDPRRARGTGILAGSLVGFAGLVRVDSLTEVALLIPVCAALWLRRNPAAVPMVVSALGATAVAAVPALWFARPYLSTVSGSLIPLVAATVVLAAATVVVVVLHRRYERRSHTRPARPGGPARLRRVLPGAAAGFVLLVGIVLASRPLWMVAHQSASDPGNVVVKGLQQTQGLPIDPSRTYAEQSVTWVVWYVGIPVAVASLIVLAAATGLAVRWWLLGGAVAGAARDRGAARGAGPATTGHPDVEDTDAAATVTSRTAVSVVVAPPAASRRRASSGAAPAPNWLIPALVGLGSTALTLYRPAITPDHPWADRRLVPIVLPVVIIAATAAAAWGARYVRRRMPVVMLVVVSLTAITAILLPPYQASRPLATRSTEQGEPGAVAKVCAQLAPNDVVVTVDNAHGDNRAQNEWVQVIRGVCGRPSAALRQSATGEPAVSIAALNRLAALAGGAGHQLVVLTAGEADGSGPAALKALGQQPRQAVLLRTFEDAHMLVQPPTNRSPVVIDIWLATWQLHA